MSNGKETSKTYYIGAVCFDCNAPANIPLGISVWECNRCHFVNCVFSDNLYPAFEQPVTGPKVDASGRAVLSSLEDE